MIHVFSLYFDPSIGALIVQVLVAAVAGVVLFSKNLMYKIKLFFGIIKEDENQLFDDIDIEDSKVESNTSDQK